MSPPDAAQCVRCRHFGPAGWSCPAFPGRDIPEPIRVGAHDHRTPYPGQAPGILFDPIPPNPSDLRETAR